MPRPDLISPEYITPVTVTTPFGGSRYNGSSIRIERAYSNLRPKPLSSRRRRFIGTNVAFAVLHLCTVLTLVIYMTTRQQAWHSGGGSLDGGISDLWCSLNCSQMTRNGDGLSTLKVSNVNETQEKDKGLCCVARRDSLSTNYNEYLRKQTSTSKGNENDSQRKIFDGIRLKDKWIEDDPYSWPRFSPSVLSFNKKENRFTVIATGTYFVHSRIDFTCLNKMNYIRQDLDIESRTSIFSVFIDEMAQLGLTNSTSNGTFIYTSTVNVIVRLQKGDGLKFTTKPSRCASPRTLVVYQSRDVV